MEDLCLVLNLDYPLQTKEEINMNFFEERIPYTDYQKKDHVKSLIKSKFLSNGSTLSIEEYNSIMSGLFESPVNDKINKINFVINRQRYSLSVNPRKNQTIKDLYNVVILSLEKLETLVNSNEIIQQIYNDGHFDFAITFGSISLLDKGQTLEIDLSDLPGVYHPPAYFEREIDFFSDSPPAYE